MKTIKIASHRPALGAIMASFQSEGRVVRVFRVNWDMWMEKLTGGVLELDTSTGARYVEPNLLERAYLIWTFRNFFSLPQQVLRPWERRLIDHLWCRNRFVSLSAIGEQDRPIIGRVERRAPAKAEVVPIRKPASSSKPAVGEQSGETASA